MTSQFPKHATPHPSPAFLRLTAFDYGAGGMPSVDSISLLCRTEGLALQMRSKKNFVRETAASSPNWSTPQAVLVITGELRRLH